MELACLPVMATAATVNDTFIVILRIRSYLTFIYRKYDWSTYDKFACQAKQHPKSIIIIIIIIIITIIIINKIIKWLNWVCMIQTVVKNCFAFHNTDRHRDSMYKLM